MSKITGILITLFFILAASLPLNGAAQTSNGVPENFPQFSRWNISPFYYSTGLQLGQILNLRRERPIFSTYEGDLILGFGSKFGEIADRDCVKALLPTQTRSNISSEELSQLTTNARHQCALLRNPWHFSFLNQKLFDEIATYKDRPVVIYFINYFSIAAPSHLLMRTTNTLLDAFPLNPNLDIPSTFRIASWRNLHPEAGFITGRVVRASLEHSLRKSYEVVVQESQNTDSFRALTVDDGDLFQFITQAMLTGRLLRIEFIRLFHTHSAMVQTVWTHMTGSRIIGVEIVPDQR